MSQEKENKFKMIMRPKEVSKISEVFIVWRKKLFENVIQLHHKNIFNYQISIT